MNRSVSRCVKICADAADGADLSRFCIDLRVDTFALCRFMSFYVGDADECRFAYIALTSYLSCGCMTSRPSCGRWRSHPNPPPLLFPPAWFSRQRQHDSTTTAATTTQQLQHRRHSNISPLSSSPPSNSRMVQNSSRRSTRSIYLPPLLLLLPSSTPLHSLPYAPIPSPRIPTYTYPTPAALTTRQRSPSETCPPDAP